MLWAIVTVSVVALVPILLYLRQRRLAGIRRCLIKKNLNGKVALVTGASSGLGLEVSYEMAERQATVIMAGHNEANLEAAISTIHARIGHKDSKLVPMAVDLASLSSVRSFSDSLRKSYKSIDILVNNAGVMSTPFHLAVWTLDLSREDLELQFAVNYLSHFYLTELIWDLLLAAPEARVLNVSSGLYKWGHTRWYEINYDSSKYYALRTFASSMLAKLLHTEWVAKTKTDGTNVKICSTDPGFVWTNLGRFYNPQFRFLMEPLLWYLAKTPEEGVQTYLQCVLTDKLENGGYYRNCEVQPLDRNVVSQEAALELTHFTTKKLNGKGFAV